MTADEFVFRLKQLAPTIDELMAKGLSRAGVEDYVKAYDCPKKKEGDPNLAIDPILDLLDRYDTSTLEIVIITLNPEKRNRSYRDKLLAQKRILIGSLEADPLVLNQSTGEIENLDYGNLKFVICKCAANGARFLDALYLMASYKKPHPLATAETVLTRNQEMENYTAALRQAQLCARASGVAEVNGGIYLTLLGAWEPE